jgi:hypothetical protein
MSGRVALNQKKIISQWYDSGSDDRNIAYVFDIRDGNLEK